MRQRTRTLPPRANIAASILADIDAVQLAGMIQPPTDAARSLWLRCISQPDEPPRDLGVFWLPLDTDHVWPARVVVLSGVYDDPVLMVITCDPSDTGMRLISSLHDHDELDESMGGDTGRTRALSMPCGYGPESQGSDAPA